MLPTIFAFCFVMLTVDSEWSTRIIQGFCVKQEDVECELPLFLLFLPLSSSPEFHKVAFLSNSFFFCCLYSCSNFIASIYSSNFFSAVFIILCFCSTPENGQSGSILNMSPRLSSYFNTVSTFDIFACLILAHQMLVKYYSHLFLEFFISLTLLNKFTLLVGVLRGSSVFPSFSSGSVCGNV